MGFAREVADRVVMMDDGRIIEEGSPERLFHKPEHKRTQAFLSKNFLELEAFDQLTRVVYHLEFPTLGPSLSAVERPALISSDPGGPSMGDRLNSARARDIAYHLHPYTNASVHEKEGPLVIARGEGIYVYDDDGQSLHRGAGRPVLRLARLQRGAPGRGRDAADAQAAVLSLRSAANRTSRRSSWPSG